MLSILTTLLGIFVASSGIMAADTSGTANTPGTSDAVGVEYTAYFYHDNFIHFSGSLIVPTRVPSRGAIPYVWAGMIPKDSSGVLQNVLDGRERHWYFHNVWKGTPAQPDGGGFNVNSRDRLGFVMNESPGGQGNWFISSTSARGQTVSHTFNIGKQMFAVGFVVETYNSPWDFGAVVFENVLIQARGTDTGWCNNHPNVENVKYTFENVAASVNRGVINCNIGRVTLRPA